MQRRSHSHYFASGECTHVMFDAQVTLCYSWALEMTNSRLIFPWDNRSSHSRRAKLRVWTLERASETQPTRELRALKTHPLESCEPSRHTHSRVARYTGCLVKFMQCWEDATLECSYAEANYKFEMLWIHCRCHPQKARRGEDLRQHSKYSASLC